MRYRVKVLEKVPGTNTAWITAVDEPVSAGSPIGALLHATLALVTRGK